MSNSSHETRRQRDTDEKSQLKFHLLFGIELPIELLRPFYSEIEIFPFSFVKFLYNVTSERDQKSTSNFSSL